MQNIWGINIYEFSIQIFNRFFPILVINNFVYLKI